MRYTWDMKKFAETAAEEESQYYSERVCTSQSQTDGNTEYDL